jgi:peptidoglycan/xylan/chitin deacetylase (PgdA/CDA1 family)
MFGIKRRYTSLKKKFSKKLIVLMYHSIDEPDIDPWELSVSPFNFEQQLQVLQKNYHVVSIPDVLLGLQNGKIEKNGVALTFDDGYKNNFDNARPRLEKYNIPATFFVPTQNLGDGNFYWWDKLAELILKTPTLPESLSIVIENQHLDFSIDDEANLNATVEQLHRNWVIPHDPPTRRGKLFQKLWQMMQPLPPIKIEHVLDQLETWAGRKNVAVPPSSIITENQLRLLSDHSLFTIGLHTANHLALSYHSKEVQEQEIIQNQKDLEHITNKAINTIAYPYGEYSTITVDLVGSLGLKAGFSIEENLVFANSEHFNLGRFHVKNWNAKQFDEKLTKWLNQSKS